MLSIIISYKTVLFFLFYFVLFHFILFYFILLFVSYDHIVHYFRFTIIWVVQIELFFFSFLSFFIFPFLSFLSYLSFLIFLFFLSLIGDAILTNQTLKTLILSNNGIESRACFTLCMGIIENSSIKKVCLDGNPVGKIF